MSRPNQLSISCVDTYQISKQLKIRIKNYCIENNKRVEDIAKALRIELYCFKKVLSPTIKMSMYETFFRRIAEYVNFKKGLLLCEQPLIKSKMGEQEYTLRKTVFY